MRRKLGGLGMLGVCERERPVLVSDSQASMLGSGGSNTSPLDIQADGDRSVTDRPRLPGRFAVANEGGGEAITRALSCEWDEEPSRCFVGDGWLVQLGDLPYSDSDCRGESNEGDDRLKDDN